MSNSRVKLGDVYIAPDVKKVVHDADIQDALRLHQHGDWGDAGFWQRRANEQALRDGGRITSEYQDRNGKRFKVETGRRDTAVTLL